MREKEVKVFKMRLILCQNIQIVLLAERCINQTQNTTILTFKKYVP